MKNLRTKIERVPDAVCAGIRGVFYMLANGPIVRFRTGETNRKLPKVGTDLCYFSISLRKLRADGSDMMGCLLNTNKRKVQEAKAVFLFAGILAGSTCVAADGLPPSEYTLTVKMVSLWLSDRGEVLSSNHVSVRIGIDSTRAIIQPWASDQNKSLVFFTWATSPFRANEWIVGGQSQGRQDVITNVYVNNHPVFGAQDTYANLARILYLPASHPTYQGISEQERLYIPIESSFYQPEEIDFRISEKMLSNSRIISSIVAVSPPYYYRATVGTNAVRLPFRGAPSTRKLWTLNVTEITNWNGILLPSQFSYTRYQDPLYRAKAEDEKPIVLVTGSLVSAEVGAETDIRPRLSQELSVADLRLTRALGRAVRYSARPGAWPEINSKEYERLIETNRLHVAQSLSFQPVNQPPARWQMGIVLSLLVMTVIPVFMLYRSYSRKQKIKSKTTN